MTTLESKDQQESVLRDGRLWDSVLFVLAVPVVAVITFLFWRFLS
jgi:hypothetical protein